MENVNGETIQRLAAPTDERRFFEPEKPMREPLKIDEATIRAHQFAAPSTPGTRENALGWIRKNGGLDYRAIRDSYGKEEALQLRKRLGPGMFKTDGMPLDKAAQGLSLEGAPGLDSDTALFQTLMGEKAGEMKGVMGTKTELPGVAQVQIQGGSQALPDRGQMEGVRARPGRYDSIRELVRATLQKGTRPILDKMFVDYAKVDGRSAAKIKEVTGLDVLGYDRTLTGGGIMHSVEWHGPGGKRLTQFSNQLPLTEKDILRLPEILTDPDEVELGNKAGREGEPRILSKKRIGDAYVVAEEIHSSKQRKKLVLVTMWKERAETPPATPETVSAKNGGGDVSALQPPDASGERSDSIGATLSQATSPRLREGAEDSIESIARSDLAGNVQNTEDVQRLAAPVNKRRFFEPEKPMREPLKIDEATIRAHQFAARPVPESVSNISFKGRPEEEIRSIARARVDELAQQTFRGIEGEEIYFALGQGEDWDSYTNHLVSGFGGTAPNVGRARALWLVEETINKPAAVFEQENGNRAYVALYEGEKQQAHHIVVQVAPDGRARTVTSITSKDSGRDSAKASNYLKSQIKRAANVLYMEGITGRKGFADPALARTDRPTCFIGECPPPQAR